MAVAEYYKYVKQAAWLGWKLDSNWADPTLFAIYNIIRPISGLLIVGFMYVIVSAGSVNPGYFAYLFIGSTFFVFMIQLCQSMAILIPEEKARYESMKQVYISPGSIKPYIIGRALSSTMNAMISVVLTFALGDLIFTYLFKQPLAIDFARVNYPALFLSLVFGIVGFAAIGYILSAISLVSNRLQWSLSEYVIGVFLLLCGVWFPPTVLPPVLNMISNVLPVTWFLTSVRQSMLPSGGINLGYSLLYLGISSFASIVFAFGVFSWCERYAKSRGIIDSKAEA
ncbi:MAG: ABC transporter permease [Thaumarchaeota archaeon]|nr:ABC transporter permease [Nitrososphaerota archaeon]